MRFLFTIGMSWESSILWFSLHIMNLMPLPIISKSIYHGNKNFLIVYKWHNLHYIFPKVHRLPQMFQTLRTHISLNIHWISIKSYIFGICETRPIIWHPTIQLFNTFGNSVGISWYSSNLLIFLISEELNAFTEWLQMYTAWKYGFSDCVKCIQHGNMNFLIVSKFQIFH